MIHEVLLMRVGVVTGLLAGIGVASAATVRGTVTLPAEVRSSDAREGHWRVENGVLPVGPRTPDPRTGVVVALEGSGTVKRDDKAVTLNVELHGLRLDPHVVLAQVGATLNFKNADRVPHALYFEGQPAVLPPEPTPSGQTRSVKLTSAGEYTVRDQEYPHVDGSVVVLQTPFAAQVDDKGAFKIDAPEGKYTLKVFFRGQWVMSQPLEVGPRSTDVSLQLPAPAPARAVARPAANEKGE
jgi:plastocyanin